MGALLLRIEGEYEVSNVQVFSKMPGENFFRPEIVLINKEFSKILTDGRICDWSVGISTFDGGPSHFTLEARKSVMLPGGSFDVNMNDAGNRLVAKVAGDFEILVDDVDTLKYLKKSLKAAKVGFAVTSLGFERTRDDGATHGLEGGPVTGLNYEDYSSMPLAKLLSTDIAIVASAAPKRKSSEINLPIKMSIRKSLNSSESKSTKEALESGLQLNVGLTIERGINEFIVRASDISGSVSVEMQGDALCLDIDGFVKFKPDAWVRKYKEMSPFKITVNSYWDSDGAKIYLGKYSKASDSYSDVVVGEVSIS